MKKQLFVTLLLGSSSPLYAATSTDPVVVTATRTAQTVDETLAAVTVITRQDIERQQATSVQDALRGVPGLSIANNGGLGKVTSVFLRGTESDHVLVLVDGIKVGSATAGTAAFEHIPIEQIERIEVVRGPRSSLYGSEAIGGVIQIFTRRGGGGLTPFFNVGAGTYDTYNTAAGVSGGGDNSWFNLSANHIDTDGFNACRGDPVLGGCFTTEPDKDGYRNSSVAARAGYRFGTRLEVDVSALQAKGTDAFDGSFQNRLRSTQQVLGSRARFSPLAPWNITVAAGRSRDELNVYQDDSFTGKFNTKRDTLSLQNDVSIGANQIVTAGVDYQNDRVDSTTAYTVDARDNTGVFAQYQGGFGAHDVQASLRRDDNEQFGNETTGSAAWGYALGTGLRVTASYGTGFKAPSFNDLYFPEFGNPDLEPEQSRSVEVGLRRGGNAHHWAVNFYRTRIKELIAFDAATFLPVNVSEARIRGVEAIIGTRVQAWNARGTLTLLDPENRSNDANHGNVLPRRAQQSLRLDLERELGRYRIGAALFAEGRRFDDLANTRRLGGYATVDLRGEYAFAKDWRVQARIENVFDKDYETAEFFNQPGRGYYITLRYRPQP